jgi:hypothetical protein
VNETACGRDSCRSVVGAGIAGLLNTALAQANSDTAEGTTSTDD